MVAKNTGDFFTLNAQLKTCCPNTGEHQRCVSVGVAERNYTYDTRSNRLLEVSGVNAQSLAYDAAGNTVARDARTYRYDDSARLAAVTIGGVQQTAYSYNAGGEQCREFLQFRI